VSFATRRRSNSLSSSPSHAVGSGGASRFERGFPMRSILTVLLVFSLALPAHADPVDASAHRNAGIVTLVFALLGSAITGVLVARDVKYPDPLELIAPVVVGAITVTDLGVSIGSFATSGPPGRSRVSVSASGLTVMF
jgi:hypothetical protein